LAGSGVRTGRPERGDFTTAYLQRSEVLRQHGGLRTGAEIDQWGRPVIPAYQYNTEDTENLWQWVQRCPVLGHVRFQFPAMRVLCVIAWGEAQQVEGSGTSRGEALCRAALALAHALRQHAREAGREDDIQEEEDPRASRAGCA